MSGERGSFACHPLHEVTIAANHIDVIIEQRETGSVVMLGKPT